jgi:hypothetical protein
MATSPMHGRWRERLDEKTMSTVCHDKVFIWKSDDQPESMTLISLKLKEFCSSASIGLHHLTSYTKSWGIYHWTLWMCGPFPWVIKA